MAFAIFMFILFLTLFIGANIYVPYRLANLLAIKRPKPIYIFFAVGAVSVPAAMLLNHFIGNGITAVYYLLAATWMGIFLLLFSLLVDFEVINLLSRNKMPKKASAIVIMSLVTLLSLFALWNARTFDVSRVDIPLKGLQKEVRLIHISDVHIDVFRGKEYLEEIVEASNRQNPDLVVITGDIIDSKQALTEENFAPLKKFAAPVYFCPGNHEEYSGREKALKILTKNNVRVLINEVIETHNLQLIGLDYMNADSGSFNMHGSNKKATIRDVMATLKIAPGIPTVLLHHSPVGVEYINRRGIDLMLSGHTHGGQIYPANLVTGLLFPYKQGLYNYKGTHIYVSQGAGTFGPRMRLGTDNEITLIRLGVKEI